MGGEGGASGTRRAAAGGALPPPRKRLGQHFLSDPRILGRIADALELTGNETVLEIGPGRGSLTEVLLARAARVVAVELDRALAALLRERWADEPRFRVVEADVLDLSLGETAGGMYVLAGNVPYYITTPILFHSLRPPRPERAVFLVQREVAERVSAAPGSRTYGALSVNVQALAGAEVLFRVAPGAFQPAPRVDSALLRVTPRADPIVAPAEEAGFSAFVQDAFGLRRKQMRRVVRTLGGLSAGDADKMLVAAGVSPDVRPEALSPADFARVFRALGGAARAPAGTREDPDAS